MRTPPAPTSTLPKESDSVKGGAGRFSAGSAMVLLIAGGVAFALAYRLHRAVSRPIASLAAAARTVAMAANRIIDRHIEQ